MTRPADSALQAEIRNRFGVLPNFFRLTSDMPEITANLWGMARFAYLDNPLPSLFKERLFVYLSRFCEIRYCIARHVGFLVGLGWPSGDRQCPPENVEEVVRLIRRALPRDDTLERHLAFLKTSTLPLDPPMRETPAEEAVFGCAAHVFLQTSDAARCLESLRRAFGEATLQNLLLLLTFVRAAHYWTRVHPEIVFEDDVQELLATHAVLAKSVLNDPEASACETTPVVLEELHSLRRELMLREEMERVRIERARAEARAADLTEADRRKTEFLAMLAHELRNPLAPIRNALEIIRLTGHGDDTFRSASQIMGRQVEQMVRLIDDLLDVNRIDRGDLELRRKPVELSAAVSQAVESIQPLRTGMKHVLIVKLPRDPVYLDADPARLSQIVANLLSNACKFTEPGGPLELECQIQGGMLDITIRDNGIGIPAEQVTAVFEMFKQLDRARSQGGMGIGLSLVKKLVEMHGGTVEARSRGTDQGSEFTVRLPILLEVPLRPEPPAAHPAAPSRRILVVDDNRDAAASFAELLGLQGHDVHLAHDGLEAVAAAARLRPDVVLLDIGLPGIDGHEAARRIRAQGQSAPLLVAVTGWGEEEVRRRSAESGFNAHLVKPVSLDALAGLLTRGKLDANTSRPARKWAGPRRSLPRHSKDR